MSKTTVQHYFECDSVENFKTVIQGNKLYIDKVRRNVTSSWVCSYSYFKHKKFEKGEFYCAHIIEAQKNLFCGWREYINGGSVVKDSQGNSFCPSCGNKAVPNGWVIQNN